MAAVTTLGGHRRYPAAGVARATAAMVRPCGICGMPVRPGPGRRPGARWYCGRWCRSEAKRRARLRREHARGTRPRPAVPCEWCGRPYYPVPGRVPRVGGLCTQPDCQREWARRYRALRKEVAS